MLKRFQTIEEQLSSTEKSWTPSNTFVNSICTNRVKPNRIGNLCIYGGSSGYAEKQGGTSSRQESSACEAPAPRQMRKNMGIKVKREEEWKPEHCGGCDPDLLLRAWLLLHQEGDHLRKLAWQMQIYAKTGMLPGCKGGCEFCPFYRRGSQSRTACRASLRKVLIKNSNSWTLVFQKHTLNHPKITFKSSFNLHKTIFLNEWHFKRDRVLPFEKNSVIR